MSNSAKNTQVANALNSATFAQVEQASRASFAIKTHNLTKQFGMRAAVNKVSIEVPAGAFLSIFGPNGAGKTTLLRMLSTLSRPSSGDMQIAGMDAKEEADKIRARIGLISHNSMLYENLTAEENLMFFAKLYGVERAEDRVREMLDAVEMTSRRLDVVRTFSRGMTQRLSIARALIHDPEIVFLDEPYSGLDPHAVDIFDNILESQKGRKVASQCRCEVESHRGRKAKLQIEREASADDNNAQQPAQLTNRTFVMVSHDLEKGFNMCTHALVLARGRVVQFARREDLDFDEFSRLYHDVVGAGVA